MTLPVDLEEKIKIIEKKIERSEFEIKDKNSSIFKKDINLKSLSLDFFFNITGSVSIFFVVKNNFSFFNNRKFFLALLLIFLVLSALYLTLKKYAYTESNASI